MPLAINSIVDISLELDDSTFKMRTPAGFTKDLQFRIEVLKEHDASEGAGQVVRGVHMRLHAGSHVDAPEHNVKGGKQVQDLPLDIFAGDAVIADLRHLVPGGAITAAELEQAAGAVIQRGDRLLLRTDGPSDWEVLAGLVEPVTYRNGDTGFPSFGSRRAAIAAGQGSAAHRWRCRSVALRRRPLDRLRTGPSTLGEVALMAGAIRPSGRFESL